MGRSSATSRPHGLVPTYGHRRWWAVRISAAPAPSLRAARAPWKLTVRYRSLGRSGRCQSRRRLLGAELRIDDLGIGRTVLEELLVCAAAHYLAMLQHDNLVRIGNGRHTLPDDDD